MKTLIDSLQPFDSRGQLNVIIETPKGSRAKYAYDRETGLMILSKEMAAGMVYPFNFGFVPRTLAADGDPLDVLVLNEEPMIAGCLLSVKPIAVIEATQTEKGKPVRNDRVIGQAIGKEIPLQWQELKLDQAVAAQIALFFTTYNSLYGKKFRMLSVGGLQKARNVIDRAIELYADKR